MWAPARRPRGCESFFMAIFTIAMSFSLLVLLLKSGLPGTPSDGGLVLSPPTGSQPEEAQSLDLRPSGTFKIAIFSDLHFGEEEHGWGIEQDVKSGRVMRSVLVDEEPDLVVLNGDLITGENTFRENSTEYVKQVVTPMLEAGTPWASAYGNHDSKFNLSRQFLYAAETVYPNSCTRRMDKSLPGVTNYYVLLARSVGGKKTPAAVLWFFDSRGGASYQNPAAIDHDDIPNWVADETVAWFRASAARLQASYGPLPSLAFVHIPPHVFLASQNAGLDPAHFPGVDDDRPLAFQGEGDDDATFVDALREVEGLHSVYVGHDHGNAWCAVWPSGSVGPFLCFSKHTGYGGYGRWNRGSRIVQLDLGGPDKMRVETWVRMENHDVVTRVSLNETYGVDSYPTENGE